MSQLTIVAQCDAGDEKVMIATSAPTVPPQGARRSSCLAAAASAVKRDQKMPDLEMVVSDFGFNADEELVQKARASKQPDFLLQLTSSDERVSSSIRIEDQREEDELAAWDTLNPDENAVDDTDLSDLEENG